MTPLNESQLQEVDGAGFWDGFLCGATTSLAIAAMLSPEPVSKLFVASAWTTAVGTCGMALT
jgi:hypothetical protein